MAAALPAISLQAPLLFFKICATVFLPYFFARAMLPMIMTDVTYTVWHHQWWLCLTHTLCY